MEIVTDEPIVDFDAAENSAPELPAQQDVSTGNDRDDLELVDEPSLDDFAPFDEAEAFGGRPRKKRGLFRRERAVDTDLEVHSEES